MLTPEQEEWLAHLSDTGTVKIVPFDPTTEEKFERVKKKIQGHFGADVAVEHYGASSLGISGQDEIDVYVPVPEAKFNETVEALRKLFGEPKSTYPLKRVRFVAEEQGKHVDIFVINKEHESWSKLVQFQHILKTNPEVLESYRKLKEEGDGLNIREYYRRKLIFINRAEKGSGTFITSFYGLDR